MKSKVFNPVKQTQTLTRLIRVGMARKDIPTVSALAVMLGMKRPALSKRMNHGGWSDVELWRVFRVLEFTEEEIVIAMGGAAA